MTTPELFYESWLDALKDDVKAIGGAKVVGGIFWPEKDAVAAGNKLRDCLNDERRDRLTDEQERWIIRTAKERRGFSAALYFLCDDGGFERPKSKDPMDETAKLMREFNSNVKLQERIVSRLEALQQPTMRAVR